MKIVNLLNSRTIKCPNLGRWRMLLLSETEDSLDFMLQMLSKYVDQNKMEINTNKTK